ncbi:GAD-like domain-containing protein [Mesorhizobium sp. SB112]|uniref:GAD-like domain-containing protein n=1 Tax=Mesorhizobium sp. SB112 TaxID=3151853 RepID=UPI0032675E57
MNEIRERLEQRLKRIGQPANASPLSEAQKSTVGEAFPESLAGMIDTYGIGSFFDGLLQMCDPAEFRPILSLVFKADKQLNHKDCHVFAYSAFGYLYVWSKTYGVVEIDLPAGMVFSQALAPTRFNEAEATEDEDLSSERNVVGLLPFERDDVDYSDFHDAPMFDACRASYGQIERGQCYGFFPALALAGTFSPMRSVKNIKRVKALEHFAILSQLDTFHLTKLSPDGFEAVRPIG